MNPNLPSGATNQNIESTIEGQIELGLSQTLTAVTTGHPVSADQFEPGIPLESQAFYHDLAFLLVNWQLSAGYSLTSWMTAEVQVPLRLAHIDAAFLNEDGEVLPGFESIHHRNETLFGLGDVAVGLRFLLLPPGLIDGLVVSISAGLSLPTGGIEPDPFERGRRGQKHQHIFFGTGTVDPYAALAVALDLEWLRLVGFGHAQGSLYANRYDYQGTGKIYAGLDVATDFSLEVFDTSLGLHALHEMPAQWANERAENSGRTDLMVALSFGFQVAAEWRLHTGVKLPFWSQTIGGQLDIPVIWDIGVRFSSAM